MSCRGGLRVHHGRVCMHDCDRAGRDGASPARRRKYRRPSGQACQRTWPRDSTATTHAAHSRACRRSPPPSHRRYAGGRRVLSRRRVTTRARADRPRSRSPRWADSGPERRAAARRGEERGRQRSAKPSARFHRVANLGPRVARVARPGTAGGITGTMARFRGTRAAARARRRKPPRGAFPYSREYASP